jgi:hypothetical protein
MIASVNADLPVAAFDGLARRRRLQKATGITARRKIKPPQK